MCSSRVPFVARAAGLCVVLLVVLLLCANAAAAIKCRGGKRQAQSAHPITSNGCGTAGMQVKIGTRDFTPCCDQHDACYGVCGTTQQQCDKRFAKCLTRLCETTEAADTDAQKQCQSEASMYSMGTSMLGSSAFEASQRTACQCAPADDVPTHALVHFHRAYQETPSSVLAADGRGDVDARLDKAAKLLVSPKYVGREHELLLQVLEKFPAGIEREGRRPAGSDGDL